MKRSILSMLLAISIAITAISSVLVLPAAAVADIDLIGIADPNNTQYATVNTNSDGSVTTTVTEPWNSSRDDAYGMAITTFLNGYDAAKTPYAHVDIVCDVPFRVSILDRSPTGAYDDRWITFGSEFFNTFVANGGTALSSTPEGQFFPAGSYQCAVFLKGVYDWKRWDPAAANAAYIYIELKQPGTATLNTFKLSSSSVFTSLKLTDPTTTTTAIGENMTWSDPQTLLPSSVSDFISLDGGGGSMTVTASGSGYRFKSNQGYPQAYYDAPAEKWVAVDVAEETYLHYDFEVVSGETQIVVYFGGQSPVQQAAPGTYASLNVLIDPSNLDGNGNVIDLPAGRYTGSFRVSDLGCADSLISNGTFKITGVKAFAVNGTTVIHHLYVSTLREEDTVSTATPVDTHGEQITYTVDSKEANAGETVTVGVSASEGHYMTNGQFVLSYDASKLSLQSATGDADNPYVSAVNTAIFPNAYYASAAPQTGTVKFAFVNSATLGQTTGGMMFALTFKVLSGWTATSPITLTIPELYSCNGTLHGGSAYSTNYLVVNGGVSIRGTVVSTTSTTITASTTRTTSSTGTSTTVISTTESTAVTTQSTTAAPTTTTTSSTTSAVSTTSQTTISTISTTVVTSTTVSTTSTTVATNSTTTTETITTTTEADVTARGDVDLDGKCSIADAVLVYYYVNGKNPLTADELERADVAVPAGTVNITDAVTLYYFVNGKIDAL